MTLVLAGLVAALSAGIARLFIEPRAKQRAFGGAWLAIFAVLFFLSWLYVPPWWAQRSSESNLEQIQAYPLLQEHDPEAFEELRARIRLATRHLRSRTEVWTVSRREIAKAMRMRIATASDEAALEYFRVNFSNLQQLHERGGDACHRYLLASRGQGLLAEGELTEAMLAATGDALVKVIRTSTQAPQKVPQSVDVIPHMTPIFEDLKVEYEKDMPLLQNPEAATGAQTRRTCEAAIDRMRPGCCDTWLPARNSPDLGSVRGTAPGTHARCRT